MAWFKVKCPVCEEEFDYYDDTGSNRRDLQDKVYKREIDIRCPKGHYVNWQDIIR